jgi:hypothetical protein
VSKRDSIGFAAAGLAAWGAVTAFYAAFGAGLLEARFWFYCLNAFAAAGAFSFVFHLVARLLRQPRSKRIAAALMFTAPGLIGAVALMINYRAFPPGADPASLGRYGAFLLVAYLGVAALVLEPKAAAPAR